MGQGEAWSIGRVLRWASEDFQKRGLPSPRLDAELLLGRVLGLDRVRLILDAERPLETAELAAYRELIQRRRRAEPIAYILGEREFYGLPFRVDARVLIPRPDTETLVEVALDLTRTRHLYGHALDLCTGSGCVAIAFAKRRRTWRVTGTDLSPGALVVARDNALRLGAIWGVQFLEGDLDAPLPPELRVDLITANPPYIAHSEFSELAADIRNHEPRLALDGGSDGLDLVRRVVQVGRRRLRPGGGLAVEIGAGQVRSVIALFEAAGYEAIDRHRDYGGIWRVVSARTPL